MNSDRDLRTVDVTLVHEHIGTPTRSRSTIAIRLKTAARRKVFLITVGSLIAAGVVYLFVMVFHKPLVLVAAGMVLAHFLMHSRGGHDHGGGHGNDRPTDDTDVEPPRQHT